MIIIDEKTAVIVNSYMKLTDLQKIEHGEELLRAFRKNNLTFLYHLLMTDLRELDKKGRLSSKRNLQALVIGYWGINK